MLESVWHYTLCVALQCVPASVNPHALWLPCLLPRSIEHPNTDPSSACQSVCTAGNTNSSVPCGAMSLRHDGYASVDSLLARSRTSRCSPHVATLSARQQCCNTCAAGGGARTSRAAPLRLCRGAHGMAHKRTCCGQSERDSGAHGLRQLAGSAGGCWRSKAVFC